MTTAATGGKSRVDEIVGIAKSGSDELGVDPAVTDRAESLLRSYPDIEKSRVENESFAASAVYASCLLMDDARSQHRVCEVFDVSQPTLRKRYKQVLEQATEF